jgi:ABC-type transport system involved in multi-copper enzyme maturation permease subunit
MFVSIPRILTIAVNAFLEVVRDRILYTIVLYGALLLVAGRLLPEVAAATEVKILPDVGLAAMQILGVLLAIVVGTGLINKEIQNKTIFVLIAKPLSRTEFVVGKHLGLSTLLALIVALMTVIYYGVMTLNRVSIVPLELLIHSLFLVLQLSLVTAIALFFGVFSSSLLAMLMTFGLYLMGISSRSMVTFSKLSQNPILEKTAGWFYTLLPDFNRLDLKNQVVYHLIPSQVSLLTSVGYGLLYIVVVLIFTSMIFSRKEF